MPSKRGECTENLVWMTRINQEVCTENFGLDDTYKSRSCTGLDDTHKSRSVLQGKRLRILVWMTRTNQEVLNMQETTGSTFFCIDCPHFFPYRNLFLFLRCLILPVP